MTSRDGTFDYLKIAEIVNQKGDWKQALDEILECIFPFFIFDNIALFLHNQTKSDLTDILYARAVGRGKSSGPDLAWGSDIARQVIQNNTIVLEEPSNNPPNSDRLKESYLLGLPLITSTGVLGALVFVRFAGPSYSETHLIQARYIASQFAGLIERKNLNEEINALHEASSMIALQDDFISTISHELRTPLGFIKGYSTTLLRKDAVWDEATRHEFLSIIENEADYLTGLIENILESSRLQSDTLPMQTHLTQLDTLIIETSARIQSVVKDLQIDHDFEVRPVIRIDSLRISQVLTNLFNNSIKYAPGSPIKISLTESPDFYIIKFSDSGPGILPEYLPNLFQRFYRVPGTGGSGSGLGLFICNKIIDAHGGKMSVESQPGMGTTFLIKLPNNHASNHERENHDHEDTDS